MLLQKIDSKQRKRSIHMYAVRNTQYIKNNEENNTLKYFILEF